MPRSNSSSQFIHFYDPVINAPDHDGRTLISILSWPDSKLELCHDYIQHLFPLPERSSFHPSAPIISPDIFTAFRERLSLRGQLKQSFARLLKFYGLQMRETTADGGNDYILAVVKGPNFEKVSRKWVTRFDHNHLRITRIIRCLRVLGLEKEAEAFFLALGIVYEECGGKISKRSLIFWTRAARRPLWFAPEDDNDSGARKGFLWEFEVGKKKEHARDEMKNLTGREDGDIVEASSAMMKTNGAEKQKNNDADSEALATSTTTSQESTLQKPALKASQGSKRKLDDLHDSPEEP